MFFYTRVPQITWFSDESWLESMFWVGKQEDGEERGEVSVSEVSVVYKSGGYCCYYYYYYFYYYFH